MLGCCKWQMAHSASGKKFGWEEALQREEKDKLPVCSCGPLEQQCSHRMALKRNLRGVEWSAALEFLRGFLFILLMYLVHSFSTQLELALRFVVIHLLKPPQP